MNASDWQFPAKWRHSKILQNQLQLTSSIIAVPLQQCISLVQVGSQRHYFDALFRNSPDLQLLSNGWNKTATVG
jgi:hypothetical protein